MVIAWELRDGKGGLLTTFYVERNAIKAKEKLEARGDVVRLDKVFDHHLKDRKPVVKKGGKPKKKEKRQPSDIVPDDCHPVSIYVRSGDLITSELGLASLGKGKTVDGITRFVISERGRVVPVIAKDTIRKVKEEAKDGSQ